MTYPPQHPTPPQAFPSPAPRGRRTLPGLLSAIAVAAALVLQVVATFVTAGFFAGSDRTDYAVYGAVSTLIVVLQGLLALVAIVLGSVGLAARERPKGLAGIGLGGGTVLLFGILVSQVTNLLIVTLSS